MPLYPSDPGGGGAVTNAGTFAVQEDGDALTALQLIDDAVSGAGFNITQFGGASVPIGAGLEATAVRVTFPTDGTGIVGLAAGTNAIGKLAANSGVDIGDVDVLSVPTDPFGANADAASTTGSISAKLRRMATDVNAALDGSEFQVDVVAALPTGANTIGDVTLSGDALTALQLIDDPVATLGTTTYTEATSKGMIVGAVRNDALAALAGTDNEIAPLQVDAHGALFVQAGGFTNILSANFTRPADTTAYASGDLVANSTTAASCTALSFSTSRYTGGTGYIRRVKLVKSDDDITNATFRVHFFDADPFSTAPAAGDNGALSLSSSVDEDMYMGFVDIDISGLPDIFAGGNVGWGAPNTGFEFAFNVDTVYAVVEARAAYTPASAEVFDVFIEIQQD